MVWVAIAGPISNVLLAVAFALAANLLFFLNFVDPRLSQALRGAFAL